MPVLYLADSDICFETGYGDNNKRPVITVKSRRFDTFSSLVMAYPALANEANLSTCCALCTHLHRQHFGFVPIEDIDEFRIRYRKLTTQPSASDSVFSTADFGPYDVSEVAPPRIVDNKLIYYVEETRFHLPYRVEVGWPPLPDVPVRFVLLPLLDEE